MPVSNLSPWQQFLSQRFPGRNAQISPQAFDQAANEFFGPLPIPPGSQIINQSAGYAEYVDAQGFRHVLRRSLDGRDPNAGQVQETSDRPATAPSSPEAAAALSQQQGATSDILKQIRDLAALQGGNAAALARGETPAGLDTGIQGYLDQIKALSGQLQANPQLLALDPETQAALDAISQAEQQQLRQQFGEAQGTTIAQLFGNRVNQSSIANDAIARLLQQQGLVSAEQLAGAAARGLQTRQFLTNQQQAQRQLALQGLLGAAGSQLEGFRARTGASQAQIDSLNDLLKQFTAQQTQRDIAEAGLSQEQRELEERRRQANLGFELNQQTADQALAASRGGFVRQILGSILGSGLGVLAGGFGQGGIFRKTP